MPLVSVLMSVFNGEVYLENAIKSILAQDFSDFEFLIKNDGSTDSSQNILDRLGKLESYGLSYRLFLEDLRLYSLTDE